MITLLYIFLIYILLGSVLYLIAEKYNDKELTEFQQELFLFLGWVFKLPILLIMTIDGYILPTIKQKSAIRMIKRQYNKQLKNKNLTDEERQLIIRKRDILVDFLSNVGQSELDKDEE